MQVMAENRRMIIHTYSIGQRKKGWQTFLKMLESYKSKHNYSAQLSAQIKPKSSHFKVFDRPQDEKKVSYADKFKQNKISPVLDIEKQSNHQQWVIENPKVFQTDFNNLWVVACLFELSS